VRKKKYLKQRKFWSLKAILKGKNNFFKKKKKNSSRKNKKDA
jgi:hypothetical protein